MLKNVLIAFDGCFAETAQARCVAYSQALAEFGFETRLGRPDYRMFLTAHAPGSEINWLSQRQELAKVSTAVLEQVERRAEHIMAEIIESGAVRSRCGAANLLADLVLSPVRPIIVATT